MFKKFPSVKTVEDKIALCKISRAAFWFMAGVFGFLFTISPFLFDLTKKAPGFHLFSTLTLIMSFAAAIAGFHAHHHLHLAKSKLALKHK